MSQPANTLTIDLNAEVKPQLGGGSEWLCIKVRLLRNGETISEAQTEVLLPEARGGD